MQTCKDTFAGLDKWGMMWCGIQVDRDHFLTRDDKPETVDSPEVAREEEFVQQLGQMALGLIGHRLRRRLASSGPHIPFPCRRAHTPLSTLLGGTPLWSVVFNCRAMHPATFGGARSQAEWGDCRVV